MKRFAVLFSLLILFAATTAVDAVDWTRFRGPSGFAASDATGLPTTWSSTENVVWRTDLPGLGSSSPVTLGNRIYLTCYSGYATSQEDPGDQNNLRRHVTCLDASSGDVIWNRTFMPSLPESKYSAGNSGWHGYATSTPATDGEHLYVFFGRSGVYCLTLEGEEVWHADVGSKTAGWGSGNSLLLYEDLVIVNASIESTTLYALNKASGEVAWEVAGLKGCRNTPILVDVPGGATELVLSLPGSPDGSLVGYDPATGEELWRCRGIPDRGYVVPSLVANEGIIYCVGGRKNTALAVRAGGRGDVTATHELWRTNKGTNVSSPVYQDGYLFWVHERRGVAYCLDAETGEVVYESRLSPQPGIVYSSVTAGDGKLYYLSQHKGTYVLAAEPEFQLLARNEFEDDDTRANACPVVLGDRLLLRNDKYLYCIGEN